MPVKFSMYNYLTSLYTNNKSTVYGNLILQSLHSTKQKLKRLQRNQKLENKTRTNNQWRGNHIFTQGNYSWHSQFSEMRRNKNVIIICCSDKHRHNRFCIDDLFNTPLLTSPYKSAGKGTHERHSCHAQHGDNSTSRSYTNQKWVFQTNRYRKTCTKTCLQPW